MYSKAVKTVQGQNVSSQEQTRTIGATPALTKKSCRALHEEFKMNVSRVEKQCRELLCILDEEGVIQSGEDALACSLEES